MHTSDVDAPPDFLSPGLRRDARAGSSPVSIELRPPSA